MDLSILKTIRKGKKITLTQMSESVGISRRTLGCIENNKVNPSLQTLEVVCTHLGVRLAVISY
jgi:DNA-binding XRE family transcriptional regulator